MREYIEASEKLHLSPNVFVYQQGNEIIFNINGEEKRINSYDDLSFEDKIFLFYDWVDGWFFSILTKLISNDEVRFYTGFIILISSLPFIEMMEQIETGKESKRSSKRFFVAGFKKIFEGYRLGNKIIFSGKKLSFEKIDGNTEDKTIKDIYDKIRNGLMHNLMVKSGVKYNYGLPYAFEIVREHEVEVIKVNPKEFVEDLKKYFESYILKLKQTNSADRIRENFKKMIFKLHGKLGTIKNLISGFQELKKENTI